MSQKLRVLVCGGRDFADKDYLFNYLDKFCTTFGFVTPTDSRDEYGNYLPERITIISGKARGADSLAADWAITNWVSLEEYPADWEQYGKPAGIIRNKQMLDTGIDVVIAFSGGKGTGHMVSIAKDAGVIVIDAA